MKSQQALSILWVKQELRSNDQQVLPTIDSGNRVAIFVHPSHYDQLLNGVSNILNKWMNAPLQ